jgi:hypothetical protein
MTEAKREDPASTVHLITFRPTLAIEGPEPIDTTWKARWARRRIRRRIVLLVVAALGIAVLTLGPGLYRQYKTWRATQLALQSEAFTRKNQIEAAISAIRSAFLLSPNAPEVLRAMAQLFTACNVPNAMTYWDWLLESKEATDDDRRAAAECAMQDELYNEASVIIKDLLARNAGDARNELLAARWSSLRGTPAQTIRFATRAVNDDPTYKLAVLFLALQEVNNTYLDRDGISSLFQLAGSDDAIGLTALRHLAIDPNLKPDEIARLITRLRSHPLAGEIERLAALNLDLRLHPGQRKVLIDQAVAGHQNSSPADLATFAEWLNTHGEAARVLTLISRERALSNKDIFTAYIDALGILNRWADLKSMLSGATVPLDVPLVELYLSRSASEMGDDAGSDLHWQKAVAAASTSAQSLHLALYAEKLGQNDRAATVYRTLTQDPITSRVGYEGLMRVLGDKDTRTLRDLLQEMVMRWPRNTEMENEYVYLNLLLNEHVPEMHQRALKLLADDSNNISHRTNVALACLRLNDAAGALEAYGHVSIDWNAAPPSDLIVYAATLSANGHGKAAHQLLLSVNRHKLRPELRDLTKSIP